MKITEIAVRRPVFTVIVYVAITVFGLYAAWKLPIDMYPEFENPVITVVTLYPGASSWDVEEKVTKPMEKGLGILPGLKEITSRSMEGVSAVFLTFQYSTKLDDAAADVRNSIDFVKRTLFDRHARIYDYMDRDAVESLVQQHLSGTQNRRLLIWSFLNVEVWLRLFV